MKPAPSTTKHRRAAAAALTVTVVPKVDRARAVAAAQRIRELSERRKPSRAHGATEAIRELRGDGSSPGQRRFRAGGLGDSPQ